MSRSEILAIRSDLRGLSVRLWHLEQAFQRFASPQTDDLEPGTHPTAQDANATPATPPTRSAEPSAAPREGAHTLIDALAARKSSVRAGVSMRPEHPQTDIAAGTQPTIPAPRPAPLQSARANESLWPSSTKREIEQHDQDRKPINLEWLVGGRIYAILGALVVIAGVGLFLKLAWDRGWFAVLPDAWKCILSASFGGALLITGEILRKKWGALASIGCSAAGLGVIYASAYASYGAFHLVSHQLGFAMLAATAVLGVVIGARARLVSIAIVSMLGAYLTPFFFLDVEPAPLVLPAYLTAVLLMGLTLCARLGGRFVATRSIAWWGTVLLGGLWTLSNADQHPAIAGAFLCLSWGAIQGELILSALRGGVAPGAMDPDAPITRSLWARVRPFSVSFSTSAWAGFLGGLTMHWWYDAAWMATGAGFVATAVLGSWLAGHVRVLRDTPESDRERLGAVFVAQAGVFLIMTIALGLAGWLEVAAWIAMGVAAVVAGRWMRARPLDIYGIVTLALASLRLILFDKAGTPSLAIGTDVAGLFLTRWSVMMALCALAWIATGELIRRTAPAKSDWIGGTIAMQIIGGVMLAIAPFDDQTSLISIGWVWAALACASFLVGALWQRPEWRWTGLAALLPALLAAFGGYEMWAWTDVAAPPLAHGAWWFSIVFAVAWLVMGRWISHFEKADEIKSVGVGIALTGGFAVFLASTLEVARVVPQITDTLAAQRAAVSIWWGLCAVGMLGVGFARRHATLRHVGLTLLGIATAKAVIFDLIEVSAGWRVASFVLLGVLMIGVAAVYTRLNSVFNGSAAEDGQSTDDTGVTPPSDGAEAIAGE